MKKMILIGVLLSLIGFILLKTTNQNSTTEDVPGCQAKMITISKPVEKFEGVSKPVDFSNFPEAKTYYTRITESVKRGPNFAGHYRLATWGCGTDCFGYALIDLNSGGIISYEPANPNYHLRNTFDITGSYFILDPLYAGEDRKFYAIKSNDDKGKLELVCTEKAETDYYLPIVE